MEKVGVCGLVWSGDESSRQEEVVEGDSYRTAKWDGRRVEGCACVDFRAFWTTQRHDGSDVRSTFVEDELWCGGYEVSAKHFETNLQTISAGLSLSMTIIGARHVGQSREGLSARSCECTTGVICNNRRQTSSRTDRWEFAMKPKCRIRTKPFGSTCRRNRRMNSSAETVIFFCLLP